ncbi:glutamate receptor-interacting protein 1-like [Hydractinia symbiolongicarpus]|uniref:glutamate receptor-interacting protein 1-like n=1 Tax=Hydractinia symbiolongicarpus TaxID=13093 RepID=UPI0025511BEE|nr:glutamate receptor-interacting protein 1-like [Hydractinia symbiolongicarpus]
MRGMVKKWVPPGCIPKGISEEDVRKASLNGWNLIDVDPDKGTFVVILVKTKQDKTFGLTISGGNDKSRHPYISNLKANGLADRSELFCVDDKIIAISDNDISNLNHDEIIKIVHDTGLSLKLEIQYKVSKKVGDRWKWKNSNFFLHRERNGFCFDVKGGVTKDKLLHRPVIVSNIAVDSNLENLGIIFAGDEILSINGQSVNDLHSSKIKQLINQSGQELELEVKYPTGQKECQITSGNSFVVQINRENNRIDIGITLSVSFEYECDGSILVISEIREGSLADRTDLLAVGHLILSINNISLDGISLPQANQMLWNSPDTVLIEVMGDAPCDIYTGVEADLMVKPSDYRHHVDSPNTTYGNDYGNLHEGVTNTSTRSFVRTMNQNNSFCFNTLPARPYPYLQRHSNAVPNGSIRGFPSQMNSCNRSATLNRMSLRSRRSSQHSSSLCNSYGQSRTLRNGSVQSFSPSFVSSAHVNVLCRYEVCEVVLFDKDLGVEVQDVGYGLVIVNLIPQKSLLKTGVVSPGDRILSINGTSTENMIDIDFYHAIENIELPLTLTVEFDVSDSIVPNQGTFTIKSRKNNNSTGLLLTSTISNDKEEQLRIHDIKKGSPAYRLGVLAAGDQLLSLNGECVNHYTPEYVYQLIEKSNDPIEVTIKKDEEVAGPTFSVELTRNGESLGMSLSGSEQPFEPIIISHVSEDGLAYRSNAINIGDQILAINECTLRGKTLSQADELLKSSGNKVKFLIKRKPVRKVKSGVESHTKHVADSTASVSEVKNLVSAYSCEVDSYRQNVTSTSNQIPIRDESESNSTEPLSSSLLKEAVGNVAKKKATSFDSNSTVPVSSSKSVSPLNLPGDDARVISTTIRSVDTTVSPPVLFSDDTRVSTPTLCSDDTKVSPAISRNNDTRVSAAMLRNNDTRVSSPTLCSDYARASPAKLPSSVVRVSPLRSDDTRILPLTLCSDDIRVSLSTSRSDNTVKNSNIIERPAVVAQNYSRMTDKNYFVSAETEGDKNKHTQRTFNPHSFDTEVLTLKSSTTPFRRSIRYKKQPLDNNLKLKNSQENNAGQLKDDSVLFNPAQMPFVFKSKIADDAVQRNQSEKDQGIDKQENSNKNRTRLDSDVVLYLVELQKPRESDEFGFSVSESSLGSGVYIKTIQKGSPADMSKAIKKYDRILKVNGVCTRDLSYDHVVPLLQQGGTKLDLVLERKTMVHVSVL